MYSPDAFNIIFEQEVVFDLDSPAQKPTLTGMRATKAYQSVVSVSKGCPPGQSSRIAHRHIRKVPSSAGELLVSGVAWKLVLCMKSSFPDGFKV